MTETEQLNAKPFYHHHLQSEHLHLFLIALLPRLPRLTKVAYASARLHPPTSRRRIPTKAAFDSDQRWHPTTTATTPSHSCFAVLSTNGPHQGNEGAVPRVPRTMCHFFVRSLPFAQGYGEKPVLWQAGAALFFGLTAGLMQEHQPYLLPSSRFHLRSRIVALRVGDKSRG